MYQQPQEPTSGVPVQPPPLPQLDDWSQIANQPPPVQIPQNAPWQNNQPLIETHQPMQPINNNVPQYTQPVQNFTPPTQMQQPIQVSQPAPWQQESPQLQLPTEDDFFQPVMTANNSQPKYSEPVVTDPAKLFSHIQDQWYRKYDSPSKQAERAESPKDEKKKGAVGKFKQWWNKDKEKKEKKAKK